MEKNLDKILEDLVGTEGVTGCLVTDKLGLCLGARGNASVESSGILAAIAHQAQKLDPHSKNGPTIVLENDQKQCIIQSNEKLLMGLYKNNI